MFFPVKNCLKLNPVNPIIPALPVTSLTLAAVSPEIPFKATSPPGSLSEKPGFIVIVTVTWLAPVSLKATVPTDPEIPRLFEVRSKLMESARADETQQTKAKTEIAKTDFAVKTRMRHPVARVKWRSVTACTRKADPPGLQEMKVSALL